MMKLYADRCAGCEECVQACPFNAVTMAGGVPVFLEGCTMCGACVDACPSGAIERPAVDAGADLSTYRGVWVFAETRDGRPVRVVAELLAAGRRLADATGQKLGAILLGHGLDAGISELAAYGADQVFVAGHPDLAVFRDEPYAAVMAAAVRRHRPAILLFGATATGRSLAPRLAARLRTGLTADCTALDIDPAGENLLQTRPAFGGNIMATIACPAHRPQMATVRPGVLRAAPPDDLKRAEVIPLETGPEVIASRTTVLGFNGAAEETVNLADASIIVSGGRGLGCAENFALVRELAGLLGGVVGASRAAVEEGWIPYAHQVGQTGQTVSPRLYVACGISGAVQHLAGMQGADTIVAVNRNPDAPIFKVATYGMVGDVVTILRQLIRQLKED